MTSNPTLQFDKEMHVYTLGGRRIENVTSILKEAGLIDTMFYTEEGRQIGEAVHMAAEFLDRGIRFDRSALDPRVEGRLRAYERFKNDVAFVPEMVESRVYNPIHDYCGSLDRVGSICGKRSLIDLKSGFRMDWHGLQGWAYDDCVDVHTSRVFGLYLRVKGTYDLVPYGPDFRNSWSAVIYNHVAKRSAA